MTRTLVWFRGKDLRVADHAPLRAAMAAGEVIPLFVADPFFFAPERAAAQPHRMQILLDALTDLAATIATLGSRLVVVGGRSVDTIPRLVAAWKVDRVVAHRWTEPFARERDRRVAAALAVPFLRFEGETLVPPGSVHSQAGRPYEVYTPFARAVQARTAIAAPLPAPGSLPPLPADVAASLPAHQIRMPTLADLRLARNPRLLAGGELAGRDRLRSFLRGPGPDYADQRDRLDVDATSRLSIDLEFGTLSPRAVWHAAAEALGGAALARFQAELLWREFAYHLLWEHPDLLAQPFRPEWQGFPWRDDPVAWQAWVDGLTGYPIVDAAARQLRAEGFVPNRARMIAASFLTKHLLIDFRHGEAHYLRWLADGDWASNDLGWQWSTGCGVDAMPYHRVFNPSLQAQRFDPHGTWVRRWLPELGTGDYPPPIVDHAAARARFLAAAAAHLRRGARAAPSRRAAPATASRRGGRRSSSGRGRSRRRA
jgi:deoxyribodipyrimidine photo-lyase